MLARLRSLADALLRRRRFEQELTDEVRFHLGAYTADLVRQGLVRRDADGAPASRSEA